MSDLLKKKKELETVYSTVVGKLSKPIDYNISLKITYLPICADIMTEYSRDYSKEDRLIVSYEIRTGKWFFTLSSEEKEAIIAHELGHYEHKMKHYNTRRFERLMKWGELSQFFRKHKWITRIACALSKKDRHRIERLQEWHTLSEFYADKKATEIGRGEYMLNVLVKSEPYYKHLPAMFQKKMRARIENLEKILKENQL